MKIFVSEVTYETPRFKVIEVNAQSVLCQSGGTEKFGMSSNSYNEDDWD